MFLPHPLSVNDAYLLLNNLIWFINQSQAAQNLIPKLALTPFFFLNLPQGLVELRDKLSLCNNFLSSRKQKSSYQGTPPPVELNF